MIVCTFGAGCVSTDDDPLGSGNTVIPDAVNSEAQKEFNKYIEIYNTKPSDYEIATGELESYTMRDGDYNRFFAVAGDAEVFVSLNSNKKFNIKNGVLLEEYSSAISKVFLIKDSSVTKSYVVSLTTIPEGYDFTYPVAYIMYLTPEDYNGIIKCIDEWFEK